jgi:hypothetical protein
MSTSVSTKEPSKCWYGIPWNGSASDEQYQWYVDNCMRDEKKYLDELDGLLDEVTERERREERSENQGAGSQGTEGEMMVRRDTGLGPGGEGGEGSDDDLSTAAMKTLLRRGYDDWTRGVAWRINRSSFCPTHASVCPNTTSTPAGPSQTSSLSAHPSNRPGSSSIQGSTEVVPGTTARDGETTFTWPAMALRLAPEPASSATSSTRP